MPEPLPSALSRELTRDEVFRAVDRLLDPAASDDERAAFLVALSARGETGVELAYFAEALLPRAVPVPKPDVAGPLLDCCGTGGGGLSIFNVSTAAMFVLAAGGVPVVKHGNVGVTKKSGSADVMRALGLRVELAPEEVGKSLADLGFAFLYAPAFHPAFKAVGPVRKRLGAEGKRTVFNLMGPLLNPLRPEARLVGVFKEEHVSLFAEALRRLGDSRFVVVRGTGGGLPLGEASPEANLFESSVGPVGFDDFQRLAWKSDFTDTLRVGDAAESAALVEDLLRHPHRREVGIAHALLFFNAGVAFAVQGKTVDLKEGYALAERLWAKGAAFEKLQQARAWARAHPGS